ncbi:MAG: hydroxymethylpyrimidine/phosphomethylpyrimidine kinase [Proteobacteria bacterium]|nr:hydroxymethylpyrimidine/phosphomethylpyrimidine kinase [Pseudomonadota bacterium]
MKEIISKPSIVALGGLDPTGGAGILQDVAAARAVGVHGAAVLALSTVQDGKNFKASHCEKADSVRIALETVLQGVEIGAIKTGAMGNAEIVEVVADLADTPYFPCLVVDPVMRSTTQGTLLDDEGVTMLRDRLLPVAVLVTPNLAEARILTDSEVSDINGMRMAGMRLVELGARAALIKGGHLMGDEIADVFVNQQGEVHVFKSERHAAGDVRGTGCALASLIAGLLARGYALFDAIKSARTILLKAIHGSTRIGTGPRVLQFPNWRDDDIMHNAQ